MTKPKINPLTKAVPSTPKTILNRQTKERENKLRNEEIEHAKMLFERNGVRHKFPPQNRVTHKFRPQQKNRV